MERRDEYTHPGGAPYYINYPIEEVPQTNTHHDQHEVVVQDLRPGIEKLAIDVHGFQMFRQHTSLKKEDFEDDETIRGKYYPEVEALLKDVLGATRVSIWEHTTRRRVVWDLPEKDTTYVCSHREKDQTPDAVRERVQRTMAADAERLLGSRVQVINVWRPLSGPVNDYPLALGDARTFDLHRDGLATTLVFPHYVGQAIELHYHPEHRWYYASEQQNDELWVFKNYDSCEDVATGAPHCSFDIQKGGRVNPPRESIEVRCMVFYEEDA